MKGFSLEDAENHDEVKGCAFTKPDNSLGMMFRLIKQGFKKK